MLINMVFFTIIDINEVIKRTINWYLSYQNFQSNRYNVFKNEN